MKYTQKQIVEATLEEWILSGSVLSNSLQSFLDSSLPGSSVHGILQARILEWVSISFSRVSFQPRDQTQVSCIAGGFFTTEPPRKPIDYF